MKERWRQTKESCWEHFFRVRLDRCLKRTSCGWTPRASKSGISLPSIRCSRRWRALCCGLLARQSCMLVGQSAFWDGRMRHVLGIGAPVQMWTCCPAEFEGICHHVWASWRPWMLALPSRSAGYEWIDLTWSLRLSGPSSQSWTTTWGHGLLGLPDLC